jgi:hypothetical protein
MTMNRTEIHRFPVALALGLALVACAAGAGPVERGEDESVSEESVPVEVLEPGVEHSLDEGGLRLTLVEVPFDNRCPRDVQCITGGEARVTLAARDPEGGAEDFTVALPAGHGPRTVSTLGYRLELVKVEPEPISTWGIAPEEYRLHLRCTVGEGDGDREGGGGTIERR